MGHRSRLILDALTHHNRHLTRAERAGKYGKMAQSAFRFYRGTNHLFWADFGQDERLAQFGSDKTRTWIQGDLHTDNYGAYGNDDGQVVYSLNDFDDSVVADYQYDLWRMAVSIVLVAQQTSVKALSMAKVGEVVDAFVDRYLETVEDYRGNSDEHHTIFTGENLTDHLDDFLEDIDNRTTLRSFLNAWTVQEKERSCSPKGERKAGWRRFNYEELGQKLRPVGVQEWDAIAQQLEQYGSTLQGKLKYDEAHFEIQDIAKRINAGTGSLGATRYYVLITAGLKKGKGRILDIKHQIEPTPYRYMAECDRHLYDQVFAGNHAHRHALAYRALTNQTDDYLGWIHLKALPNHDPAYFSVRELSPYKRSFDVGNIRSLKQLKAVAANWGMIVATAHARADKDFDATFVNYSFDKHVSRLTKEHHDDMRELVKAIALPYAEQVEADWQTFLDSNLQDVGNNG